MHSSFMVHTSAFANRQMVRIRGSKPPVGVRTEGADRSAMAARGNKDSGQREEEMDCSIAAEDAAVLPHVFIEDLSLDSSLQVTETDSAVESLSLKSSLSIEPSPPMPVPLQPLSCETSLGSSHDKSPGQGTSRSDSMTGSECVTKSVGKRGRPKGSSNKHLQKQTVSDCITKSTGKRGRPKGSHKKHLRKQTVRSLRFDDSRLSSNLLESNPAMQQQKLMEDQHIYPPQHETDQSEDFDATQSRLDYFARVLNIKTVKYSHLIWSRRSPSCSRRVPLAQPLLAFIGHYWPGRLTCCGQICANSSQLNAHIGSHHPDLRPPPVFGLIGSSRDQQPQSLEVVADVGGDVREAPIEMANAEKRARPSSLESHSKEAKTLVPQHYPADSEGPVNLPDSVDKLTLAIEDELRLLRRQLVDVSSMAELLQLMEKILSHVSAVYERLKSTSDPAGRCALSGSLEWLWNASKMAIVRWQDLDARSGPNCNLTSIQSAYKKVPVFIDWSSQGDRLIFESVIHLTSAMVRFLQTSHSQMDHLSNYEGNEAVVPQVPSSQVASLPMSSSQVPSQVSSSQVSSSQFTCSKDPSRVSSSQLPSLQLPSPQVPTFTVPSSQVPLEVPAPVVSLPSTWEERKKTAAAGPGIKEFCRLVNTALGQKTYERQATGFKDDGGFYHPIYRYDKLHSMLRLYAPPSLKKVRCCSRIYSMPGLRFHVTRMHENPNAKLAVRLSPV